MKKYFLLLVISLMAMVLSAQNPDLDSLGRFDDGKFKSCTYEAAYLKNHIFRDMVRFDDFRVGYDRITKTYKVYIVVGYSALQIEVKYHSGSAKDGYLYDGFTRNGLYKEQVSIFCKNKLSLYTQNYGALSKAAINDFDEEAIHLYFPSTEVVTSIVPIKNTGTK